MSIRWRLDGRLLCAAMTEPEEGDTYIDDRLHYALSVEARVLIADADHETNGLWHWTHGDFLRATPERRIFADPGEAGRSMAALTHPGERIVQRSRPRG